MALTITKAVVIARDTDAVLLVSADDLGNPMAPAQTWAPGEGYSDVKPLGVWLKFLYYLAEVNPPEKWIEPA